MFLLHSFNIQLHVTRKNIKAKHNVDIAHHTTKNSKRNNLTIEKKLLQ